MKYIFLYLLILLSNFDSLGQNGKQVTVPLNGNIEISVLSVDTNFLDFYDIYKFNHKRNRKLIQGEFWVDKKDTILEIGTRTVKLCRIIQMQQKDFNLRGCAFYNGLSIYEDSILIRKFEFDEKAEFPFLRICSTD
ncbi:MAG: hypothetical protein ACJAUV_000031 [Flavobacteriales bacterium]